MLSMLTFRFRTPPLPIPRSLNKRNSNAGVPSLQYKSEPGCTGDPPALGSDLYWRDGTPALEFRLLRLRGIGSGGVRKRNVSIDNICRISWALGVEPADLVTQSGRKK